MRKTIIAILIVAAFLSVAVLPALASENKVVSIVKAEDDKNIKQVTSTVTIDVTTADALVNQITELQAWFTETRPFKDLQLTEDEINAMKARITTIIDTLNVILIDNGQDPVTTNFIFKEMFETELGRSTIASLGKGYAYIPFYDYETFLGVMLRPMWFLYPPLWLGGGGGYTGNFNVNFLPPRIEYGDRLGPQLFRTTMFTGLYINIGDLGYDNIFAGTIIVLGQARVVM